MEMISAFGNSLQYAPERGGIVTSIRFQEQEILYLDETTFQNCELNVRGGIPIIFPNAGPIESPRFPGLKQHGYARLSPDWKVDAASSQHTFTETLQSSPEMKRVYPYANQLSFSGSVQDTSTICFTQTVENLETIQAIPIAMGLHPYFIIPQGQKHNVRFECLGSDLIHAGFDVWSSGATISITNPKLLDPRAVIRVTLPGTGTLILEPSVEYERIWVWSLPEKEFICIEPMMRDIGGLVDNPCLLEPGQKISATFQIRKEST